MTLDSLKSKHTDNGVVILGDLNKTNISPSCRAHVDQKQWQANKRGCNSWPNYYQYEKHFTISILWGMLTSDLIFVIRVEICATPLNKWGNAFYFVFLPPGHGLWNFPIFDHHSALQYVVQGNLWDYWFHKEQYWIIQYRTPFLNLFFLNGSKPKKSNFIEPKNGSRSHF